MIARRLKVYKDTYALMKLLARYQTDFTKQFRYTLGERIQQTSLELFDHLQMANTSREERVRHLDNFIVRFESLKTLLRLAFDLNQIGKRRQAAIYDLTSEIGKQISAWKNSSYKQLPPK